MSIIIASVLFRWFIFEFPVSFIGGDPDRYAIWSNIILQTGHLTEIPNSFYQNAPNGILLPALVSMITGVHLRDGFGIYALLIGVMVPFLSISFAHRIQNKQPDLMIGAAVMGSTLAVVVKISYLPIPQNLGTLLFQVFILFLLIYHRKPSRENQLGIIIVIVALAFTHKLHLFLILCVFAIYILYKYIRSTIWIHFPSFESHTKVVLATINILVLVVWFSVAFNFTPLIFTILGSSFGIGLIYVLTSDLDFTPNIRSQDLNMNLTTLTFFFILVFCLWIFQWAFQTTFLKSFFRFYAIPILSGGSPPITTFSHATQSSKGALRIFYHQTHNLILLLGTTIISTWMFMTNRDKAIPVLSAIALLLFLSPMSILVKSMPGIGATRLVPNFAALIAAILSIGFINSIDKNINAKMVAIAAFVILLVFQTGSFVMVPDYPGAHRSYLQQDEVDAKEFVYRYTSGEITTDYWYADESISPLPNQYTDSNTIFERNSLGYLNKTLFNQNHKYILLRTSIKVYRFNVAGFWELNWKPSMVPTPKYNTVYDNGGEELLVKK
ncbi:MAG: hypothetical protein ABEI13_02080 [Candidatus Paceibacteria bacterium]